MTWIEALLLALLTGATEILPVSGTGHWKLLEKLMGLNAAAPEVRFLRGMLHLAVCLGMVIYYRKTVGALLAQLLGGLGVSAYRDRRDGMTRRLQQLVVFALLPLLPAAALYRVIWRLELSDNALAFTGVGLLLSGLVIFFSERFARNRRSQAEMVLPDALLMGLGQTLSILPGLSRSGVTTGIGLLRWLDRPTALSFAGLIAIPAYFCAGVLELVGALQAGTPAISWWVVVAAMAVAAAVCCGALELLTRLHEKNRTGLFAYWCWGAAAFSLILLLLSA